MSINSGNPLSAVTLAACMTASLPKDAQPQLQSPYDAIALFSHACMTSVGFRLIGLGEDHKIGQLPPPSPFPSLHQTTSSTTHNPIEPLSDPTATPQPLPAEWNAHAPNYAFRYAHTQSAMQYVLKLSRLGAKAVIFGLGLGDDKTASFDVIVADYISPAAFPFPPPSQPSTLSEPDEGTTQTQTEPTTPRQLEALFLSPGRITDLASLFKLSILQKLAPGIQKEGYEDTPTTTTTAAASSRGESQRQRPPHDLDPFRPDHFPPPARPHPFADPLAAAPRPPFPPAGDFPPPGFEDEYEIGRPPRGGIGVGGLVGPGRNPLNIGENDLYPPGLGPHDPLRPGFGPGFGPGGGLPGGGGGGGGMHPTFDDPLFGGARGWDSR